MRNFTVAVLVFTILTTPCHVLAQRGRITRRWGWVPWRRRRWRWFRSRRRRISAPSPAECRHGPSRTSGPQPQGGPAPNLVDTHRSAIARTIMVAGITATGVDIGADHGPITWGWGWYRGGWRLGLGIGASQLATAGLLTLSSPWNSGLFGLFESLLGATAVWHRELHQLRAADRRGRHSRAVRPPTGLSRSATRLSGTARRGISARAAARVIHPTPAQILARRGQRPPLRRSSRRWRF